MIYVKFDHSVKYNGTRYAAHEAFSVEEKDIEFLKQAGAIILPPLVPLADDDDNNDTNTLSGNDAGAENEGGEDVAKLKEELVTYTVPELKAFAEERGIDLDGKTLKADIYNAIVSALN